MWVACLPWYDRSELRWAHEALWSGIAAHLRARGLPDVPPALDPSLPYRSAWASGELLFGQACGYDVLFAQREQLQLVATPCYAAPGCLGPRYSSFIVVRADAPYRRVADLRAARAVVNDPGSHSGANVLRHRVAPLAEQGRFFSSVMTSGSHERSLAMLTAHEADVAAIDCVTHALLAQGRPRMLGGTRVLETTETVPAPPYVTAVQRDEDVVAQLRRALQDALADPQLEPVRKSLLLQGTESLPLEAYESIAMMRRRADALGYVEIPPG